MSTKRRKPTPVPLWELAGLEEPWAFARAKMTRWFVGECDTIAGAFELNRDKFVVEECSRRTGRTTRILLDAIPALAEAEKRPDARVHVITPSERMGENVVRLLDDLWRRIHGRGLGLKVIITTPEAEWGKADVRIVDHTCHDPELMRIVR